MIGFIQAITWSKLIFLLVVINVQASKNTWSVSFVFDNLTANSVASIPLSSLHNSYGNESGSVLVSLDLGSNFFAVAIEGLTLIPNGYTPLHPLPQGTTIPFNIDDTSIVNASYGSGGFQARLATGRLLLNSSTSTVINFGAMINYEAPFPIGGPKNVIGILGLNYPYGPPYCVNSSVPVITPYGRNCAPSEDAVVNMPLLQQLNANGLVSDLTVTMRFEGSTPMMNRYGTLTLGSSYNTSFPTVPLEPIYGIEYTQYYITRIPALLVNGQPLNMTEVQLQGGTYLSGCCENWFGGWIIDSGWLYTVLPYYVYLNTTAAMWASYQSAGGTMSSLQWNQLVTLGLTSGNNCSIGADYCTNSLENVPCVILTINELNNLPMISLQLYNSSNGETIYWNYPSVNYMYQITTGCYQLGLTVGDGAIIGNLQMQGHVVFVDQTNNIAQFYPIDTTTAVIIDNSSSNKYKFGTTGHIVGLTLGLFELICVLIYLYFYLINKCKKKDKNKDNNKQFDVEMEMDNVPQSESVLNPVAATVTTS